MRIKRRWIPLGAAALAAALAAGVWWLGRAPVPEGFASGNGRLEADEVDVATQYAGRVAAILVEEGDLVGPGEVLARMDTAELEASLREAQATARAADQSRNVATSLVAQRKSECDLADSEFRRSSALFEKSVESKSRLDVKRSQLETARAARAAAEAQLRDAEARIEAANASVERIQTQIDDAALVSPVRGRVLYRLSRVGEVLSPGGRVLTLVDLTDVYMEIFLPSREATRVAVGTDARVVLDAAPQYVIPATVSFVSPEAQFTPKQVETPSERDKLMFRVKVRIPATIVEPHIEIVKTGIRGIAYVQLGSEPAPWPPFLEARLPPDGQQP